MLSLSVIVMISLELTWHFCIYELFLRQETTSRYFNILICAFNISEILRAKTSLLLPLPTLPPSPPRLIQSKDVRAQLLNRAISWWRQTPWSEERFPGGLRTWLWGWYFPEFHAAGARGKKEISDTWILLYPFR